MHETLAWILGIILAIYLLVVLIVYGGGFILKYLFFTDLRTILIIITLLALLIAFARKGVFKKE